MRLIRSIQSHYRMAFASQIVKNNGVKIDLRGGLIHPDIVRRIYKNIYEDQEIALLRQYLKPDDRVLDLGAGIGHTAIFAARFTGSKVYAVEANKDLLTIIAKNAKLNLVNIETIFGAVSVEDGEASFYVNDLFFASSMNFVPGSLKISVPAFSIRSLLNHIKPSFLSVDIEGAEYDILPLISKEDVRCIIAELHDELRTSTLIYAMTKQGFRPVQYGRSLVAFV
jgi:FkbM family methyltransferase